MGKAQHLSVLLSAILGIRAMPAAKGDPPELKQIQAMAVWHMSHPDLRQSPPRPEERCGIQDTGQYEIVELEHEVDEDLNDEAATQEVKALNEKVLRLLQQGHWTAMKTGPNKEGIHSLDSCHRKDAVIVQISGETARCTMNTPCTAFDGLSVLFYLPKNDR
jgi:hypothetical protein